MVNVTWDTATATAVTLSGSNLVATSTGTTSADQGARVATANGKTAGKYYFEITLTTLNAGGNRGLGICRTTSTYTAVGNASALNGGITMFVGSGNVYRDGSNQSLPFGVRSAGNVIGVAVDFDNAKLWFRVAPSGNWNTIGTDNPATNTGGIATLSGTAVPVCTFGGTGGVAGTVFTANFGNSAFSSAVPAGFTSGWPDAAGASTVQARAMVLA